MFLKPNIEKLMSLGKTEEVYNLLKHRKSDVRLQAMEALFFSAREDSECLKKFRPLLDDDDRKVKIKATLLFARLGDSSVIHNLHDIIIYGSADDQIEVLRLLPHYYSKDDESITQILALALKDKKQAVQLEAIKTIGEMEISTMAFYLIEFANDKSSKVRFDTVVALGRTNNSIAVNCLIGALTDSSPEVRNAAEVSLKSIGTEKALDALRSAPFMLMVKNMNESASKRLLTVTNIGRQRNPIGLPLLHKACYDEYKNIRFEAIKSLAVFRDESSIDILIEVLKDKYYDVRIEAIRALARFNSTKALDAINRAKDDPNTNVKTEAKKAFYSLNTRLESKKKIK